MTKIEFERKIPGKKEVLVNKLASGIKNIVRFKKMNNSK